MCADAVDVISHTPKVMTVMRWYAQEEVNQEESEHNEVDGMKKGVDSKGKVMHKRTVGDL